MNRKPSAGVAVLTCPLDDAECDFAAVLLQRTRDRSDANLVRRALRLLASHYGVEIAGGIFRPRKRGNGRRFVGRLNARKLRLRDTWREGEGQCRRAS